MGLSGIFSKWRRLRELAADRATLAQLRRMAIRRYNYPGFSLLRRLAGSPAPEAQVVLRLLGRSGLVQLALRPGQPGDVASFFENFVEIDPAQLGEVPPGRMLDAGAHIGCFSLAFHDHFPDHSILALEPDPANAALLRENWRLNGIPGEVHECALWTAAGTLMFERAASNAGRLVSTLDTDSQRVEVRTEALPELLQDAEPVGFLKMDIEGAEESVLPQALHLLPAPCSILVEIHGAASMRPSLQAEWERAGWEAILLMAYPPHESWILRRS